MISQMMKPYSTCHLVAKLMNGTAWITLGVIATAFAAFALGYGFYVLQQEDNESSFSLADSSFDVVLAFPSNTIQTFQSAFPYGRGNLSVILHIAEEGATGLHARLQLAGQWNGTTGIVPQFSEDLVVFNLSDRRFTVFHKKPIVEQIPTTLSRLRKGKRYRVEIMAIPGFGIPLVPESLLLRTHEGELYAIASISGPDRGWYSGTLSP